VEKFQIYIQINVAKAKLLIHSVWFLIRVVRKTWTTLTNWTSYDV